MSEAIDESARRLFDEQRFRRFGSANPERMHLAHWEWMVRNAVNPYQALRQLGRQLDPGGKPDWCFSQRYGMTETRLADGRIVYIGGEYEDSYDPEFCIYNDVIVRGPGDVVEIFGYPEAVFPPIDFHSATLFHGRIVIIGGLGYEAQREVGYTPVFCLDTKSFRIDRWNTSGDNPGWIFEFIAALDGSAQNRIVVSGGRIYAGESEVENANRFALDLTTHTWHTHS